MRSKLSLLIVVGALALMCVVVARASSVSVAETDLTAYGTAYEINPGPGGALYVSDYDATEIWHIDATGAYTRYQVFETVLDARPDSAGDLWFTDGATTFGRLRVPSGTLTTWQVPELHNLWGLAFDAAGRVWMTEFVGAGLYRFDPAATQLCTYTLPSYARSYYILHDQGQLWLRNWDLYRIYRLDIATNQARWWQWDLGPSDAEAAGLALDGGGNLWWADPGREALVRLEPNLNQMTTYALPVGSTPRMLEVSPGGVWYTEDTLGTLGLLDPASAAGTTTALSTGSGSVSAECAAWGAGTTSSAQISTGTLSWTLGSVTTLVDGGGWKVYGLATGASPYGIADRGGSVWAADQGRQKLVRLFVSVPAVDLEKRTNGQDADSAPGPAVTVGESVHWTYRVENTGKVDLTGVRVVDDNGTPSNSADDYACVIGALAAGAVDDTTCSQSGIAVAGQYANAATVTAEAGALQVSDTDPSHYFGAVRSISLEKHTNGQDADSAPGPVVSVGDVMTWTYRVENTGNLDLSGVSVLDDNGTPSSSADDYACAIGTLAVGAADDTTCSQSGTAVAGQYTNTATATGYAGGLQVSDADPSHYFGVGPGIRVEKHTNGQDADGAPGPSVIIGDLVTWTYRMENTGNADLTDVTLVDDNGTPGNSADDYTCVVGNLAVGAVDDTTCLQSGTAVAGQYANTGTVTAYAAAVQVSDTDPSHYLGEEETTDVFLPLVLKKVAP